MRLCRRGKGYVGIREAFCEENKSSLVLSLLVLAILFSQWGSKVIIIDNYFIQQVCRASL